MKKILLVLLIIAFLLIGIVSADLQKEGITSASNTIVDLKDGTIKFTDTISGIWVSTSTQIDDKAFVPVVSKIDKGELVWTTGEKILFLLDDPITSFKYAYNGNVLKETIVLKQDTKLVFPITISPGSKFIPWDNGQWKIVSATSGDTMAGIVAAKPFGTDAAGHHIEMQYTWDEKASLLSLVYDKDILVENTTVKLKEGEEPVYDKIPISYPLTIDPTWTSYDGHWKTTDGTDTIEMWNATGTTTWTAPAGVTSVWFLIVAGGGGGGGKGTYYGGGGGAGGLLNGTTTNITGGNSYTVTVGNGGIQNTTGENSTFSNITSWGGGKGGITQSAGGTGGSGGGGSSNAGAGGANVTGQGFYGGNGGGAGSGGSGGGASEVGHVGSVYNGGIGGNGKPISITGTSEPYAGGGGGSGVTAGGAGGSGGGGAGGTGNAGTAGKKESGGGGGGSAAAATGGTGGSGVVMVRYSSGLAPIAAFNIVLTDASTSGTPTSWQWNATNLTGDNIERTFSTAQNPVWNLTYTGNYLINLTATNAVGSSFLNHTIGWNLTSPKVYFWNRTA